MMFRRLKPLHLYGIFIALILVSRLFEECGITVVQYLFVAVGFWFFILAVLRYFKKSE